jgi:mono/diheme cytochrome c family protein
MLRKVIWGLVVVGGCALTLELRAQSEPSVWDGVYTDGQAARGAVVYEKECAQCHGPGGAGGGMAPALTGAAFAANYDGQSVGDLFDRNRTTMPPGKEGQIAGQDNADLTAYLLKVNQFPSGQAELPSQGMALKAIRYQAFKP